MSKDSKGKVMDNATFWDKAAAKYAKDPISDMVAYNHTLRRMKEILQPNHNVLELGCGTGSTALQLSGEVKHYLATDVAPNMIAIARSKQGDASSDNLTFAVQDAAVLPDGSFDVIMTLNLLHLLPDLEAVLGQVFDALPSGGMLIAKTGLLKDGLWILPWIIPIMRAIGKAPYVRGLGEKEFLDLLKTAGFQVTEKLTQGGMVPRIFTVALKP
jgi:ubiquinone/menaquinone biosynthesis C-methylase UbiE